jgi:hypothetical protein
MAFEIWDAEEVIDQNKPWIRLSKNGSIVLSKSLKNALSDRIQLAYDKKQKMIRIKSVGIDEPGVDCEKTKINAKSFMKKFNIIIEETEKYEAVLKDDGAFYVKL